MYKQHIELKFYAVLDFQTHDIFVGELVQTYADDSVPTDGNIDIAWSRPLLFDMASKKYRALGKPVGNGWNSGKSMKSDVLNIISIFVKVPFV